GLTLGETKGVLERELKKYLRGEPRVAVTLRAVSSKRVWLLGRLNAPGVYPLTAPTSLLEAIGMAKGPTTSTALATQALGPLGAGLTGSPEEVADLKRSFVMRHGRLLPVDFDQLLRHGDLAQNIYLQPDDFVYLPSLMAREVYVLGAVAQPRPVGFKRHTTLVSTIASAGGTIEDAYLSHVAVVRGSLTAPRIAVVDFKAIIRGRATDVELEPHDIVYVPFAPYRTLTRYADIIVTTFVRTVGINEGARAISRGVVPVGVNVSVGQ
ncbi:MAG: SLBB domain-containing protein, partial [Pedosphaera parvula]|nr:SLBB domain-containing protein [Pedosphaera parvula]